MNWFYKQLAPMYHLLYPDWDVASETQGRMLRDIIGKGILASGQFWQRVQEPLGLILSGFCL